MRAKVQLFGGIIKSLCLFCINIVSAFIKSNATQAKIKKLCCSARANLVKPLVELEHQETLPVQAVSFTK